MQPITIEPLSYLAVILIIITLVYSFFNYRKEEKKEMPPQQPTRESDDYEKPALVAAITVMMEEKPFRIKKIVLSGKQEKDSSWRYFGRQEIMRRRMNMHE
jgi:hypothetical protein